MAIFVSPLANLLGHRLGHRVGMWTKGMRTELEDAFAVPTAD